MDVVLSQDRDGISRQTRLDWNSSLSYVTLDVMPHNSRDERSLRLCLFRFSVDVIGSIFLPLTYSNGLL